jgi:hypothetical protein
MVTASECGYIRPDLDRPGQHLTRRKYMKAVVFHGVGDIRLDDVPEPEIRSPQTS